MARQTKQIIQQTHARHCTQQQVPAQVNYPVAATATYWGAGLGRMCWICYILSMKSYTEYLTLCTEGRYDIVNITPQVEHALQKSGIREGLCLVNSMHITSSVFINDNEPGLHADFLKWAEKLAPYGIDKYQHNLTGEDNGDAHLKRTLLGREVVVAVTEGRLDFGPWETIFYGEFDGQRNKRILIKIIGE